MGSSPAFALTSFVFLGKSQKARVGKIPVRPDLLLGSILFS